MNNTTKGPKFEVLDLHSRLKRAAENGQALRDVVASVAASPGSEQTIRAALRLLVKAYDAGCKS